MKRILLSYADWSERNRKKSWFWFLASVFAPVFWLIEAATYKYLWEDLIIDTIGEDFEFMEWLDKNEFGFGYCGRRCSRIYKKEIVDNDHKLAVYKPAEMQGIVYKEFLDALLEKLKTFPTDLENHITMTVTCDYMPTENGAVKMYEVTIAQLRYNLFTEMYRLRNKWYKIVSVLVLLGVAGYFVLRYLL